MNVRKAGLIVIMMAIPVLHSCDKKSDADPNAPEACFNLPSQAAAGISITLNSECSANADTYAWEFGDGETSSEPNPAHVYQESGSYEVVLTITNSDGKSATASQVLVVSAPAIYEHRGHITSDETWVEGIHLITGDVYVSGATLTIEPGAIVRFTEGTSLVIGLNADNSQLLAN